MPGRPASERGYWLALMPVAATGVFYVLPPRLQSHSFIQFLPQDLGYLGLAAWSYWNTDVIDRLGLRSQHLGVGLKWGFPAGLAFGLFNASIILWIVPGLGYDITFLTATPHARVPAAVMLPWLIWAIAAAVELNFRGFLLGRLLVFFQHTWSSAVPLVTQALAVVITSLVFSFDPFMVMTFQHLHWIALWDGIVWSMMWLRTHSLYTTIIAHAVEVMVMYSILKMTLGQ